MARPKSCEGCSQARSCEQIYEQLGSVEGPSVTSAVVLAFLMPMVLLIVALTGFGLLLENAVAKPYQTPLALLLALIATAGVMLVVRVLIRPYQKK